MKKSKITSYSNHNVTAKEFDWFLMLLVITTTVLGIVIIYSATRTLGTNTNVIVQSGAACIGIVLMFVLCFFDYEQFSNVVKYIFVFAVFILVLVLLVGTGDEEWGAKSWIRFGPVGIQPAELAKVCFILTFSYHLSKVEKNINRIPVLFGLLLHVLILLGLIMMEPDAGSSMVFCFMFACMMFVAKLSYKYIIPILAVGIGSLPLIYKYMLDEFQQKRIDVFFNPESDPRGYGWNVIQSKIAVGSGQLWGRGFLHGTQNQTGVLPSKTTDFIFSVFSEEFGFVGALIIVFLLFMIIYRCFRAAKRADNTYGRYICTGVGAMLLFHVFENVGMCIGLMPVTGIPLPFVSYGGTSLLTNMIAIGLVMSVTYHNKPRVRVDVY